MRLNAPILIFRELIQSGNMKIQDYLLQVWEYRWQILAIGYILRFGKKLYYDLFFVPLAGGNGKVQMDELAKMIILVAFIFCAYEEGGRKTEWHIFSDAFWFAILGTVCLIAGIKEGKHFILKSKKEPPNEAAH